MHPLNPSSMSDPTSRENAAARAFDGPSNASSASAAASAALADSAAARGSAVQCPMCERASLVRRHCKTLCESCGYVESCEDNFLPLEEYPCEVREPDRA